MKFIGYFFLTFLIFISCNSDPIPQYSFYHWQSYYDVSPNEFNYLKRLNVEHLYIRYFDVDFQEGKNNAIGKLINKNNENCPFEIIPTVFITNRTFLNIKKEEINVLVDKILT